MSHPFHAGKEFANRNGAYEVMAVDTQADRLVIRYLETDQIVTVGLSLQLRIWTNMRIDEQHALKQRATKAENDVKNYGKAFNGLNVSDFSATIEGTTWRARDSMAGQVAKLLSRHIKAFTFYSKAIYPWNQAYITHYKELLPHSPEITEAMSRRVKYRIELDTEHACYGLYVERQGKPSTTDEWPDFIQAIETHWNLIISNQFIMVAYSDSLPEQTLVTSLAECAAFFKVVPSGVNSALFVGAQMEKDAAINAGQNMAKHIADTMYTLKPIYIDSTQINAKSERA